MAYIKNKTYTLNANLTKDGAVWVLTGATVKLRMRKPSGTIVERTCTIINAATGAVSYTTETSDDLDELGSYRLNWNVVQGNTDVTSGGGADGDADQDVFIEVVSR